MKDSTTAHAVAEAPSKPMPSDKAPAESAAPRPLDLAKAQEQENETLACFGWQAMLQDPAVSIALFRELAKREPNNADYWSALGLGLAKTGQRREAILSFERAVELRPRNIEAWCVLGELAMDEMEWKKAAQALRRCLELDPSAKHPHGLRARALIKKGERLLEKVVG